MAEPEIATCACGCGEAVSPGKRFVRGLHFRMHRPTSIFTKEEIRAGKHEEYYLHNSEGVTAVLRDLLLAIRVRSVAGFKPARCSSCDRPHVPQRACTCPHHKAVELLKSMGIELDMR